jgi:hypothetical protein
MTSICSRCQAVQIDRWPDILAIARQTANAAQRTTVRCRLNRPAQYDHMNIVPEIFQVGREITHQNLGTAQGGKLASRNHGNTHRPPPSAQVP